MDGICLPVECFLSRHLSIATSHCSQRWETDLAIASDLLPLNGSVECQLEVLVLDDAESRVGRRMK